MLLAMISPEVNIIAALYDLITLFRLEYLKSRGIIIY